MEKEKIIPLENLIIIIIVIWLLFNTAVWFSFGDWTKSGSFGDSFGAINSLFSGLALAGIIYTIFLQKKELELQREELKSTRRVFEIQSETLQRQQFEATFFSMVNLHHTIVDGIDLNIGNGKEKTGRDCFFNYYRFLKTTNAPRVSDRYGLFIEFEKVFKKYKSDLSHYFNNFFQILLYIDKSSVSNKDEYVSIVQSQLSSYEMSLMFYYYIYLSNNSKDKFEMVKRLAFFDIVNEKDLLIPGHIRFWKNNNI